MMKAGGLHYISWIAVVCGMTGMGAFAVGRWQHLAHPDRRALEIKSNDLYLGEIWSQGDFAWRVPVKNASSRPLTLHVRSECSCTQISPDTLTLPPGETRDLQMKLELRSDSIASLPGATRSFSAVFRTEVESHPDQSQSWKLTADVRDPFHKYPRTLLVSAIADTETTQEQPPTTFDFICYEPGMTCQFELSQQIADIEVRSNPQNPLQLSVDCRAAKGLAVGSHGTLMLIKPRQADGTELPVIEGWLSMTVVSDLEVNPTVLSLGRITDSAIPVETTINLRSRSGGELDVLSVAIESTSPKMTATVSDQLRRVKDSEWVIPLKIAVHEAGSHVQPLTFKVTTSKMTRTPRVHVNWSMPNTALSQ